MTTDKQSTQSHKHKNPYTPPCLVNYGKVHSLTQTGSKNGTENTGNKDGEMAASDQSLKENIVRIGEHPLGIGLYLFDYKPEFRNVWGHGRQFGVMAQEVETVLPEAVSVHKDGYKMVNYGMLGVTRAVH